MIREHHKQIKDGFDHLDKLAASGPASKEFVEPKVQGKFYSYLSLHINVV